MASSSSETKKDPPVFKTKVGRVQLAGWCQSTENGDLYTFTLKRSFKTKSGEFKDSFSFTVPGDSADAQRAISEFERYVEQQK